MKSRDKAIPPQSNAHPEAQDSSKPVPDNETNQGTQLQTQNADADALKALMKYRAEHPDKWVVIDELQHKPLNIDMREYSSK